MSIKTINADAACVTTFARLDDTPMVARTEDNTLLLNLPRSIDDLAEVTGPRKKGFFSRLFGR